MNEVYRRKPAPPDWPRPEGIVVREIDPATGLLAGPGCSGSVTEYFIVGTDPVQQCMPGYGVPGMGYDSLTGQPYPTTPYPPPSSYPPAATSPTTGNPTYPNPTRPQRDTAVTRPRDIFRIPPRDTARPRRDSVRPSRTVLPFPRDTTRIPHDTGRIVPDSNPFTIPPRP